ncbi:MAG: hypothetical protein IIX89_00520, partial [Oscillospiraceae bacterium]|nr:hypothetical protein [Oscillospiraceae bacterium]
EKLLSMPICQSDKEIIASLKTALEGYYGENLDIFSTGVFGNITCANGIVKITDGKLFFTLDIRYGNEVDSEKTIKNLTAALERLGFDTEINENDEGFLLDESGKPMEIILNSCREVCSAPDAQPYKTYGGTYARHLKNAFAISHSAPWDVKALGLPAGHGEAHQSDEALKVDALLDGVKYLALMVARLDEYLTK